jgi:hypothetical protein
MKRKEASALVIALVMVSVLLSLGVATFIAINDKYRVVNQDSSWQEALHSAEGGVEIGLLEIRKQLLGVQPFQTANGWQAVGTGNTTRSPIIVRSGEGGAQSWTIVRCDPLSGSTDPVDTWYRIRAHGYSRVSGGRISAGTGSDSSLRKLSLNFDRYSTQTTPGDDSVFHVDADVAQGPIAHRAVEAIVRPVSAFEIAMFGNQSIDFANAKIYLDSYDSSDPTKSNWAPGATYGVYDQTKHTSYADIGTDNKTILNASNATVWGTASIGGNDTSGVSGSANIMGHPGDPTNIVTNFSLTPGEVIAPSTTEEPTSAAYAAVTSVSSIPGGTVSGVPYDHVIQAGDTVTTVVRVSSLALNSQTLFIQGVPGKTTDAHIIVSGNINMSSKSQIILDTGVRVRVFVSGDVSMSGNGVVNTGPALNFQLYGTTTDLNGNPTSGNSFKMSGNAQFTGAIYAPTYSFTLTGGGSTGNFFGAVIANQVTMSGTTQFHYDQALGNGGLVASYKIASWFEDER